MIRYKIDILNALIDAGYNTNVLKKYNIIPGATVQRMRYGMPINFDTMDTCCRILGCQPGDLIECVPDPGDKSLEFAPTERVYPRRPDMSWLRQADDATVTASDPDVATGDGAKAGK